MSHASSLHGSASLWNQSDHEQVKMIFGSFHLSGSENFVFDRRTTSGSCP